MPTEPTWLQPLLEKRSASAICVLAELLKAAIRNGQCSANDITVKLAKEEHNVIGGVFKKLRSCGLVQTEQRIAPRKGASHGRKVYVWRLEQHAKARAILDRMAGVVLELRQPTQQELF